MIDKLRKSYARKQKIYDTKQKNLRTEIDHYEELAKNLEETRNKIKLSHALKGRGFEKTR